MRPCPTRRLLAVTVAAVLLATGTAPIAGATGDDPRLAEQDGVPAGDYEGAVYFQGLRNLSGLSAVGQQTDIVQSVLSSSIDLDLTVASGGDTGRVETGSATVAIEWENTGTFSYGTTTETGTLGVTGDIGQIVVAGTLARSVLAWDSDGNFIDAVSRTTDIDVSWVFDLTHWTCGALEYRFSEESRSGSFMSFALRPTQETDAAGFDVFHNLSVYATVRPPGGPDLADIAMGVRIMEELVASVIADPSPPNLLTLRLGIEGLERAWSTFIERGACVAVPQGVTLERELSKIQELITELIVAILEQADSLPLSVLAEVIGAGVRVGAIAPGAGGPGQELFDAFGDELDQRLAAAIESDDITTINDIFVLAVQYGWDEIAAAAFDAIPADDVDE